MTVMAIFGPPGTGKTRHLVELVNERGRLSSMFLSFTKAAAAEALSRFGGVAGVRTSTLHALAFRELNMNRAAVVDAKKFAEFGNAAGIPVKGSEFGSDELQEGDEYAAVLAFALNKEIDLINAYDHFGRPGTAKRFEVFVKAYSDWKSTYGYLDFNDMLRLFIEHGPEVIVDDVYLDEAQDCSPLQWRAFSKIKAKATFIAGDDDQAIYEWGGADPHGMSSFIENRGGGTLVLAKSYRCPAEVLDFAKGQVLSQIKRRVRKSFMAREGGGTVTRYGDVHHVDFSALDNEGGAMILVRDRWRLDEIRRQMNRDMIPYDILGGHSPWTSRIANAMRRGEPHDEVPLMWREFYRQADLTRPINFTLSTIHQAKGREADRVVVDLTLSSRVIEDLYKDTDAELRVMYVALTRARHDLILCGENPLI